MSIRAVLKRDAKGELIPRRRAATFPELTRALREYLSLVAEMRRTSGPARDWRYRSSEELILATATPVWAKLGDMTLPPMPPKQCFDNAEKVAAERPGLRYTEGFALMDGSIPTHHAWLTDPDGKALDPTWPSVYSGHAERQPGKHWSGRVVYMGIPVERNAHIRWMERTGFANILAYREDDIEELLKLGPEALL